jgi:hypothetical protein
MVLLALLSEEVQAVPLRQPAIQPSRWDDFVGEISNVDQ